VESKSVRDLVECEPKLQQPKAAAVLHVEPEKRVAVSRIPRKRSDPISWEHPIKRRLDGREVHVGRQTGENRLPSNIVQPSLLGK
jgi:hypothetical protein